MGASQGLLRTFIIIVLSSTMTFLRSHRTSFARSVNEPLGAYARPAARPSNFAAALGARSCAVARPVTQNGGHNVLTIPKAA
jgi:hypothetical protein